MCKIRDLLLALLVSVGGLSACAQTEQVSEPRKSYFDFSTYYLSNAVYFGRKDSNFIRYVHPAIAYHHKSGLSLEAGLSYQVGNDAAKRIDFYEVEGHYEFSIAKKIDVDVYATKLFFYKDVEREIVPDLKAISGFHATYDADIVSINAGADYYFAEENSLIANAGISHEFETPQRRKGRWSFEPAVDVFGGNQYYFLMPPLKPATDTSAWMPIPTKRNVLLACEFSLPITYRTRRLEFYVKPTYVIPLNPANDEPDYDLEVLKREMLSNSFFVETGVHIKFW